MKFKTTKQSGKTTFRAGGSAARGPRDDIRAAKPAKPAKRGLKIVLIALAVVVLAAGAAAFFAMREINGPRGGADEVAVSVPESASTAQVASVLRENGIIGSELVFRLFCRFEGYDGTFHFGDHPLSPSMSYKEIAEELGRETALSVETFTVTFPEGTTALKMALILSDMGACTVDEFVDACNSGIYEASFIDEISTVDKFIRLEGFLFPDTYEFAVGSTPHDMIQKMLDNFDERVAKPYADAIASSGYSLEQIIILASIVEKESVGEDSYPKVASVFFNRLASDDFPCLESDTSCDWYRRDLAEYGDLYGGGYYPGVLQYYYDGYDNIPEGIRDGYDTFSHEGIIVGAICNPGITAIEGTLSPEPDWPYYFFFTGPDKETFYWSMTADEHASQYEEVYG